MPIDGEDLRPLLDSLLQNWRAAPPEVTTPSEKTEHLPIVFALTAHTHRLTAAALVLWDQDLRLEAIPLVRAAYEAALTSMWIAQVGDALPAFLNRELRQRRALAGTLGRTSWTLSPEELRKIGRAGYEARDTTSNAVAGSFQQLCDDLKPGGNEAYGLYRFMSALVHPTVSVADQYLEPRVGQAGWPPFALSVFPVKQEGDVWLYFLAISAMWSGRATDFYDRDRRRRSELRSAARTLGAPPVLTLSDKAWKRLHVKP